MLWSSVAYDWWPVLFNWIVCTSSRNVYTYRSLWSMHMRFICLVHIISWTSAANSTKKKKKEQTINDYKIYMLASFENYDCLYCTFFLDAWRE